MDRITYYKPSELWREREREREREGGNRRIEMPEHRMRWRYVQRIQHTSLTFTLEFRSNDNTHLLKGWKESQIIPTGSFDAGLYVYADFGKVCKRSCMYEHRHLEC